MKHIDQTSIDSKDDDSFEITTKIRQQVSKWQRAQSDAYLRGLKEHEHFEIKLHQNAQTSATSTSVSVRFICSVCNKSIPMSSRQNSGSYVLSNWTRHVKTCRPEKVQPKGSQITMNKFFSTNKQQSNAICKQISSATGTEQDSQKVEKTMGTENFKITEESSQDFSLAPPNTSDSVGGAETNFQESCLTPTTDWSRKSRTLLSSLKIAADPAQTKITDYFKLIDQIESLTSNNPEFNSILQEVCKIQQQRLPNHNLETSIESFSPLLKQLLTNAKANVDKMVPQAKRHNAIIKKFSTSL